jgi:hypothetical protein
MRCVMNGTRQEFYCIYRSLGDGTSLKGVAPKSQEPRAIANLVDVSDLERPPNTADGQIGPRMRPKWPQHLVAIEKKVSMNMTLKKTPQSS